MGKIVFGMTMSLDGFINDHSGSVEKLYPDLGELRETTMLQESIKNTGAVIMGRHAYDMANGDFTDYEFQVPIFVITYEAPAQVAKGENENLTFIFITDGIHSGIEKARITAGEDEVQAIGGANTAQQLIRAGLVDEIQIGIMPILLCGGLRSFEYLGTEPIELEKMSVIESAERTDLRFRVVK
jgi:dihydrofolate reductase